jgi:RHS repeat-associated protein
MRVADAFELASDTDFKRLQYNRNRTYGPKHGRWLQRDPAGYVDGMNVYEYDHSHPTIENDPFGLFVDIDFDKLWKAIKTYWNLDDEGARYARSLMRWYAIGHGELYQAGAKWNHTVKESFWSGKESWSHKLFPVISIKAGHIIRRPPWSRFMRSRPELQSAARSFFQGLTSEICSRLTETWEVQETSDTRFRRNAPHTKLNQLPSMLLTLHGSQKITVNGYYKRRFRPKRGKSRECECEVEYKWVTWVWHDTGDLHPGIKTQISQTEMIDDKEFKQVGLGQPYPIKIYWPGSSTWRIKDPCYYIGTGNADVEYVSGWPPPAHSGGDTTKVGR